MTSIRVVLCDLDGVVWLARHPIPGAVHAIAAMRERGIRVLFVTNNSAARLAEQEDALAAIGVPAEGDVLTSALAAAGLVSPGERVLACADVGVIEALERRGAEVVDRGPCEVVVVGLHRHFDYQRLHLASAAIRDGARFIGTNDDATFPTPGGLVPGAGALVAAVATAAGRRPQLAGKPHPAMADLVRRTLGATFDPIETVMIGDRPSTDGRFAEVLGCRFALVRSGVTPSGTDADAVWIDVVDLAAASAVIVARKGG